MTDAEFRKLVTDVRPRILRALQACNHRFLLEDADEAYTDAVFALHQQLKLVPPPEIRDFAAWLYVAALRKAIDARRADDRRGGGKGTDVRALDLDPDFNHAAPSAEELAGWRDAGECASRTLDAFARRGPDEATMVNTIMMVVHGANAAEIRAINEHASDAAARQYIARCRETFRDLLARCRGLLA